MGEVIRWHDNSRAAERWASEAKYRRMVANGIVPMGVPFGGSVVSQPEMPSDANPFDIECPYFAPDDGDCA